ncbi:MULTISPECIES: PAS domain-containing hybrid sensor histidine kinase/response regulator [Brucella]|uniref:histidine kinase n=2 Tax=Ochrobactrum TaxID=528 RepID=A0ABD5JWK7_9HYPH|nr:MULTISPECIES: PAS domain-containing hybrid sensor histidine kinase/response regulator [Brucella]RRD28017.1 response regulator [Brucellaceae bacterium VT-16-1752]WHT41129.1 PAS domain-containing hybrid sensor histidine kinase/response regulator [Ochrobactrum sp. SSR]MDX4073795.1 PAS domain-containing hybrid sensor histidine kinase/response regulator [Brucella sp. NBRC 113783]WHS32383.1 PAS domain-containing hybrid sensor histidine kinase/response regulator [Brucella sp. NM4]SPL64518.1 Na+/pr
MQGWGIIGAAFLYLLLLFAVASIGDRRASRWNSAPRPYVYALSLAVYCTSWTFFGSVGLSAQRGLEFLGIYIGPILVFTLGNRLLRHIVRLAKAERITSIADFLAARYGKSFGVASLATCIAAVGSIPYIALQLKAVAGSVGLVMDHYGRAVAPPAFIFGDISLAVAAVLAVFAILFGTRHTDATEHQNGLILAIAVESVIKLCAFLTVGLACTFFLFGSPSQLIDQISQSTDALKAFHYQTSIGTWIIQTALSAAAIIMLPRQFHVTVVESRSEKELRTASWLFPVYLVLINIFVFPIALIGVMTLGTTVSGDLYVLALPLAAEAHWMALIAFLGGLSAATAMVIVACVALSIMISNHLVLPLFIRSMAKRHPAEQPDLTKVILNTRRVTIIAILALAFAYYRFTSNNIHLASIGFVSFAAIAQFVPAFIGGLFWRNANGRGAMMGLSAGFLVWAYTLLLPTMAPEDAAILRDGFLGFTALRPEALFGTDALPLTNGVIWSLTANTLFYILGSLSRASTPLERIQASIFLPRYFIATPTLRRFRTTVTVAELKATMARYLGSERVERAFLRFEGHEQRRLDPGMTVDTPLIRHAEQLLGTAVGTASARLVLSLLLQRNDASGRDARQLLDDASAALQQNRDLLQIALDQMEQGITVFDKDFRLAFWNRQFRTLLNLPDEVMQVGIPVSEIVEHLIRREDIAFNARNSIIHSLTASRKPARLKMKSTAKTLEIQSNPMPDGGIVATYTDITAAVEADLMRQKAAEMLEQRVADRTAELTHVNKELARAQAAAEEANLGKTRFLAAAGHDILQPLNAARLYSTALSEKLGRSETSEFARNIDSSLEAVEAILGMVLDISRLDTGALKPEVSVFRLDRLLSQIATDFTPLARKKALKLRVVPSSIVVKTDRNMLRRLIQNLVSNSIKYSRSGGMLLGVRRRGAFVELQVLDTGIGIAQHKLKLVFREFTRLDEGMREAEGLGLGLSIVDRIARLLEFPLSVRSVQGKGTTFTLRIPVSNEPVPVEETRSRRGHARALELTGLDVLCIDNDADILSGMETLLSGWGCNVTTLRNGAALKAFCANRSTAPDVIVADYHLIHENGIDMIGFTREHFETEIPAILLTADRSKEVRQRAEDENITLLNKPLRPAALRSLLSHFYHARQDGSSSQTAAQ